MRPLLTSLMVLLMAFPALAQNANGNTAAQFGAQLQKLLSDPKNQEKLQQGIAIASLMGCTGKTAGKMATDMFYRDMQETGKRVEALCKAKRAPQARALVLRTLDKKQNDPVLNAAQGCYTSTKEDFDAMAGPKLANDAEMYSRWIADPELAHMEMMDSDICK